MARLSAVCAALLLTVGLAACSGGGSDFPTTPGGGDAAVDTGVPGDAADPDAVTIPPDAMTDASLDGPAMTGAELSIAITSTPDPVAASATLTYAINVTNGGLFDATGVMVTQRLPPGDVAFQSATGIGWSCNAAGQVVTCTRATLLVGAAPTIAVKVTTPPVGGSITTSAKVSSDLADPDDSNNDASATALVLTPADLAIAISDAPDPVAAGGALTYAIQVTNNGPGAASAITVLDSLPDGVGFASASGADWSCSAVGQDVTCLAAGLTAGASSTIALAVTAPASGGTVSNTAQVEAATPDDDPTNNQATTSTTVSAAADLLIAMSDAPDPVLGSGTLQYAIDVSNLGPDTASGITVTDNLPAGNVTFVSASGSGWTCLLSGQVVTCTRPSLLAGAAPTITLTVQVPSDAALLTNTATVSSTSSDLNPANDTAMVLTSVLSAADLSVAVIDAPDPVTTGGALTYTVTAANAGPSEATSVTVTSQLPAGATFQSASGIDWTCSAIGQQVTCTTPQLAVGTAPAILIATTAPAVDGSITETSTISATTTDPDPASNSASQTTVVNAPSDLAIALSASPSPVPAGAALSYTIGVTNLGPRDASNLVVTDRLPDGDVLLVSATGIGWACAATGQIVTCTRPLLLVGAAPSIVIDIQTPGVASSLVDQVTVTATTDDLNTVNNTASITTGVFDSADLSIEATATPDPVRIGTEVSYTLSVTNDGPTPASNVSVVDTLPAGATFVSAGGPGWSCDNLGQIVTCTTASLGIASSAQAISIVATAPGSAGNISNAATVSSDTSDPDPTNNTATTVTLASAFADVSIDIADSPDPIQGTPTTGCGNNDCVTYTISVTNAGPDPAAGVQVVTQLPPNGSFFEVVGTGWICPSPSGTLTCTRTALDVGPAPPITLIWKAPSPGGFSIVASAGVHTTSTDPDPSNNAATQDTTVLP
jgi:uncharacterized repeat protein (TIGR01451 family)